MNAVAPIPTAQTSVLVAMSERYGMNPAAFEATVRATVCKGNVSKEEFAAFLLVAKEHRLNPLTKEIYAFPAKGGGIQPIVSIDGWSRIINEHPQLDGIEFEDVREGGELIAVECRMHRKDRNRPTSVTEYMSECRRTTDVWRQWPARMLRHKALIQCARYAFGFSGIVDPDEYERQVNPPPVASEVHRLHAGFEEPSSALAIEHSAAEPEAADVTGEVADATPPAEEPFPGDAPVEEAATIEAPISAHDTPAEWLDDARRWINDAEDAATLRMLNKNWDETGRWLALRAYSATDHADLVADMKARVKELQAAAK